MYSNLDISAIVLVVLTLKQALAVEPTIIACDGEHQYTDQNGDCRWCEMCPAGHQPKGLCGYGQRTDYGCEVCPDGTFSTRSDYNICVQCDPCEEWHSDINQECSAERNQICGPCFEGYFRPLRSDGSLDDECHQCSLAPPGTAQCEKKPDRKWQNITFIMIGVVAACVLIIFVLIMYIRRSRRRRRKKDATKAGDAQKVNAHDPVTAETRESLLQSSGSSRISQSSEDSRLDEELRVESEISHISNHDSARLPKSIPGSYVSESGVPKNVATRHPSMPMPSSSHLVSDSGYSNMPTAEFVESAPRSRDSQSPSNLPTGRYDDLHPSSQNIRLYFPHMNAANSPQSHRVSPRGRSRQNGGASSSSENLIENVDRDSREVGGAQTPVHTDSFEPDSFDTRSVTEETKPHKIGPTG